MDDDVTGSDVLAESGEAQTKQVMNGGVDPKALLQAQMMAKNTGIALILTLLFGGFGLLYVSIPLGIVGTIIEIVLLFVMFATAGIGAVILLPWHIVCIILAVVLVGRYNKKLLAKL